MKTNLIANFKQFFTNWNGIVLTVPAFFLFIGSKIAIFNFTDGAEQGYFWSQLHVISFGLLRLAAAEFFASIFLWSNSKEAFKILFYKLDKEQVSQCTFSRNHALQLYCTYVIAAALLMSFL